jgi:S-formylglutathione hydrolase FrmB
MRLLHIFILLMSVTLSQAQVPDTAQVFSHAMQKHIPTLVVVPQDYNPQDSSNTYPVLFMLHGYSGDYIGYYFHMPDLQTLCDQYQMILVCPDGGFNSWYLDAPYGNDCKYETFISKELVQFIDNQYLTRPDRKSRAICGLSMGGHGALYNAIKHPDVFGAVGSMSGGVDFTPFPLEWELSDRLGQYPFNKKLWEAHCVTNMIQHIPNDLKILIDCGVDDFFMPVNRTFHDKLLKARIPHDYIERPGGHDWEYWANATRFQLLYFYHFFNQ